MKKMLLILLGLLVLNTFSYAQKKNTYVVHRDAKGKLVTADGIENIYTNFNYWVVRINTDAKPAFNFKKAGTDKPNIKNKSKVVDNYVYGIIDTLGNFIFPPIFKSINVMGDGIGIAREHYNKSESFYAIDLNRAIVKEWDPSYKLSLIGMSTVCFLKETGPYESIHAFARIDFDKADMLDTIVTVPNDYDLGYYIGKFYTELEAEDFSKMPYLMPEPKEKYTPDYYKISYWKWDKPKWIDNKGKTLLFLDQYKSKDYFFNHWIYEESDHFGVIDKNGQVVIAPVYERFNISDDHLVLLDGEKNLQVYDKNMNLSQDSVGEVVRGYYKSLYKDYKTLAQQHIEAQAALEEKERVKADPDNLAKYMAGEYSPFFYNEPGGLSFMSQNVSGQGIFIYRLDNNNIKIKINGSGSDSALDYKYKTEVDAHITRDLLGNATIIYLSGENFTGTYDMLSKELKISGKVDFGQVVNISATKRRSFEY